MLQQLWSKLAADPEIVSMFVIVAICIFILAAILFVGWWEARQAGPTTAAQLKRDQTEARRKKLRALQSKVTDRRSA